MDADTSIRCLTLNLASPSADRAARIAEWLASVEFDVLFLSEVSSGEGSKLLLDQFSLAGFEIAYAPSGKDRGSAIISRLPIIEKIELADRIELSYRATCAKIEAEPEIIALCLYIPFSDGSESKLARKRNFIAELQKVLSGFSESERRRLVIGGDYNVIDRAHIPSYPGFWPFELDFTDGLARLGLADTAAGVDRKAAYSWFSPQGDPYRYDYFHVGQDLQFTNCQYVQETRAMKLSDHAAVSVDLCVRRTRQLTCGDPSVSTTPTLF